MARAAASSALLRGASRVFLVDRYPDRVRPAESIAAIAIDGAGGSPVDQVLELMNGRDRDRGRECARYRTARSGISTRRWRSTASCGRCASPEAAAACACRRIEADRTTSGPGAEAAPQIRVSPSPLVG
jgi:threonine dehydrogenase-like Zn-dependent dehydrogenase